ncbi:MAG: 1,4-dihydroxy-2-naphthoate polyprenyltransferase [bacterium]
MNSSVSSPTTSGSPAISPARAWLLATRPKTLAAAAVPVAVGTAVAFAAGYLHWLAALAALIGALLIQIGTNLANDYFDFKKGADTEERLGPLRVTQAGLISESAVRNAMIATFAAAALVGTYLVFVGGWPILVIGVLSILSGVAYTGGPFPLGYNGLGDVFVFIFFGLVAVNGTYWVQALDWSSVALLASVPVGLLSVAILIVNNYRDIDTDVKAGKRTLAVRMGRSATQVQYISTLAVAYIVPVAQFALGMTAWVLLPLATIPIAVKRSREFRSLSGSALNPVLENTAKLLVLFGILYTCGLAVQEL